VPDAAKDAVRARLRAAGVDLADGQQVLLYAPTWKGDFYHPDDDTRQLRERIESLRARIDTERYCVVLKVHQQVYRYAAGDPTLQRVLVPNDIPANDLLAVTDLLVTDYSSIFFDFLASGRPVVFLAPDLQHYADTRALNLAPDEWPGPVCRDLDELVEIVKQVGTGTEGDPLVSHAAAYAAARERFCPREDGRATERLIDIVFRGKAAGYDVSPSATDGRTTLLIYLGGMAQNGITASVLSLLDNIDYDRFDVSGFFAENRRSERQALIARINPNVRLLRRSGGMLASPLVARAVRQGAGWWGRSSHHRALRRHRRALRDEWLRCFGDARFDHVIDFSGYSPFWDKILVQSGSPSFSIWLHNDLKSDADRRINGRHPHRKNLYGVFELYRHAQNLVSVSAALNAINQDSLARFAGPARFTFARNTINHERILRLAQDTGSDAPVGRSGPRSKTFVTVGRLSPEKNHERLLRAFALVHQDDPGTSLLIVGDGPLRADLTRLTAVLGITESVTLAGHLPNPYRAMAQCGCFVLSSDYEGQPMVILEALVLGLPVVSTAFASVSDALPQGSGLVVAATVDALADGMRAHLRGEVPTAPFDGAVYNQHAMDEFYRAIGAQAAAPSGL
jgi:glycosyltransferase involved in cell wall biosynthesis